MYFLVAYRKSTRRPVLFLTDESSTEDLVKRYPSAIRRFVNDRSHKEAAEPIDHFDYFILAVPKYMIFLTRIRLRLLGAKNAD